MFGFSARQWIGWAIVIGLLMYVFHDPHAAGAEASSAVHSVGNLVVKGVTAVVTFFQGVLG
jgi:hypothetical protein